MHLDGLADMHQWRIRLADIGDQPDGRQIADRVDRTGRAHRHAVDVLAEPDLALGDGAADRRRDDRDRIEFLRRLGFEGGDLLVALAEDAQPVAHRGERDLVAADGVLRGRPDRSGLLPILQRAALREIELVRAFLVGLRLRELRACGLQIGKRGDQVVLRLHELACLDLEQRRPGLDMIAELGDQLDDPSGMLGKDRRSQIVVDRDIAFRHLFRTKADEANRLDLEPRPLLFGRLEGPARLVRRRRLSTFGRIRNILSDHRPREDRNNNEEGQDCNCEELGERRQMPAQKGHLPGILCHQMLSNASTCFRKSGLPAPVMQPMIGAAARLKGCFLPEDCVDRQHTYARRS